MSVENIQYSASPKYKDGLVNRPIQLIIDNPKKFEMVKLKLKPLTKNYQSDLTLVGQQPDYINSLISKKKVVRKQMSLPTSS